MAFYGFACDSCGSRDCDGCAEPHPDYGTKVRTHCPDCGRIHYREHDFYGELPKELKCGSCVKHFWPANPGPVLDPLSVLRNRRRVEIYRETGMVTWPRPEAA